MADPATLTLALKVIDFAFDANKAIWSSGLGENDFKAVKSLIDAGKAVRGAAAGSPERTLGQAHEDMTLAAFTMAWQTHWGGSQELVWRQVRKNTKEVAACLATARGRFPPEVDASGKPDLKHHGLLRGCPTRSPAYGVLWQLFLAEGLLDDTPKTRTEFPRHFRTAWAGLLPSPLGEPLRRPRRDEHFNEAVREILAWDFVDWRTRHVFGKQEEGDSLPTMPLEKIYVQPVCEPEESGKLPILIQEKLDGWLVGPPALALVTAEFGRGKSLSARMFAARLAEKYLEGDEASPAERWWPVFVRCAGEFRESIATMVALAQREQLQRAGAEKLEAEHPAVGLPSADDQKVVLILDGLDEVHLNPTQTRDLLTRLRDFTSTRRRVVVFTRPGAVERQERETKDRHFALRRFDERQIEDWLVRWKSLVASDAEQTHTETLGLAAIKTRGLMELAPTPVLLFMIAWTWEPEAKAEVEQSGLYERFFLQLARSKCEFDRDAPQGQQVVQKAAAELHSVLIDKNLLLRGSKREEALVWLLGCVAWEHARMAHRGEALLRRDVENLIDRELGIRSGANFQLIQRGLMLVLQVDPFGDDPALEFGHRSFREFLIAHYWRARLITEPFGPDEERALLGARLLEDESRTLDFLLGLLRREPESIRERVVEHAERLFFDERLGTHKGPCSEPRKDERCFLREAALALLCHVDTRKLEDRRYRPRDASQGLRSLAGLMWTIGKSPALNAPSICAPRLDCAWSNLTGANLPAADLNEASLEGANLEGANLARAILRGADLSRALLHGANLAGANLSSATLSSANLVGAVLENAILEGASLGRANLGWARLAGAHLVGAELESAILTHANLLKADLSGASLEWANLENADLSFANLTGASLDHATLLHVDLEGAKLNHARLNGATLQWAKLGGADLEGANLQGTNLVHADLGLGLGRVLGLRRALNLDKAILPEGFTFLPEDGLEVPPGEDA